MATRELADHDFRVGDSLVQPRLARIQRGGETIQVTPRAMAVLVYLAEANGVVSRNDLLDAVWPRMEVTPDALSQCIVELRRAFGDDSKSPKVIETIRKMGVRLLLPVTVEEEVEPQTGGSAMANREPVRDQGHRRFTLLMIAIVGAIVALGAVVYFWPGERAKLSSSTTAPVSGRRSIAVLPLAYDRAADERVRLFADGIHDVLLTRLANIEALDKVISRPIALGFRGTHKTAPEIGRELGVGAVLQGRLRGIEDTIRIDVQLIDTETGAVLWGGNYVKALTAKDFFAVQSEVTIAIADALNAKLSADELARLREVPTSNTRAYEYYLSGNELWRRRNTNPNRTLPLILQQFTKAVQEDPDFALAWARLSVAHTGMYFRDLDRTPARLELAEAAFRRAFELAPGLPEAHVARAAYLSHGLGEHDQALTELALAEPALRHDPDFYYLRMYVHLQNGESDLALADSSRLLELDPHNIVYLRGRSQVEIAKHDYAAAERTLDRILRLAPDDGTACVDWVDLRLWVYGDSAFASRHECTRQPAYATALASTYVRWRAAVFDRDYDRALNILDGSSEEPVFDGGLRNSFHPKSMLYARTHRLMGHKSEAIRYYHQAKAAIEEQLASPRLQGKSFEPLRISLAEVQAALGDREGAMKSLERTGGPPSALQRRNVQLAVIIRVFIPLGEHERALKELDDYLAASRGWTIEGLLKDPRIDPVRNDPGFAALVAKYRTRTDQREASLPKK